jgi:NAD(P)-dependent dehydrogenase (short-subunit alcohol dehydrogenase family)
MERVVLVTGANRGIGRAAAEALARRGARVILGCRDPERGARALDELQRATGSSTLELLQMDLAEPASIRAAVARLAHQRLDVLVNNAGVFPRARQLTSDGLELAFAVNVRAPFLLGVLLADRLAAARPARVVNVASYLHARGRMQWDDLSHARRFRGRAAYAQSKLALVLVSREQARRLAPRAITVNAVDPGRVDTRARPRLVRMVGGFLTPEAGAAPLVRLALDDDVARTTGRYFARFEERLPSRAARDDAASARLWALLVADATRNGKNDTLPE